MTLTLPGLIVLILSLWLSVGLLAERWAVARRQPETCCFHRHRVHRCAVRHGGLLGSSASVNRSSCV